jgi:hypothetical protein
VAINWRGLQVIKTGTINDVSGYRAQGHGELQRPPRGVVLCCLVMNHGHFVAKLFEPVQD